MLDVEANFFDGLGDGVAGFYGNFLDCRLDRRGFRFGIGGLRALGCQGAVPFVGEVDFTLCLVHDDRHFLGLVSMLRRSRGFF
jgi:hypothetical protein